MQTLIRITLCYFCLTISNAAPIPLIQDSMVFSSQANNHSSFPLVSRNGSNIVFESIANNLLATPLTNNFIQIYLRQYAKTNLQLVSAGPAGVAANASSFLSDISKAGDIILFESAATNLASNAKIPFSTNLFVRRLGSGDTVLVSNSRQDGVAKTGISANGVLSADGKFAFFESTAPNLGATTLAAAANYLYLKNIPVGLASSVGTNFFTTANLPPTFIRGALSSDGRYAAYGVITNNIAVIALQDFTLNTVKRVWTNTTSGFLSITNIGLSDDARYLSFAAYSSNLISSVYFIDLQLNVATNPFNAYGYYYEPSLSPTGRFLSGKDSYGAIRFWDAIAGTNIAYFSDSSARISVDGSLITYLAAVPKTFFSQTAIYQTNRNLGTTVLLTPSSDGISTPFSYVSNLGVSDDGSITTFQSADCNLVTFDANGFLDIFTKATTNATCELISKAPATNSIRLPEPDVQVLGLVTFSNTTWSVILDSWKRFEPAHTNFSPQLILADAASTNRILITTNKLGNPIFGGLTFPVFSRDGLIFAFNSNARELTTNTSATLTNHLFIINRKNGTTKNLTAYIPKVVTTEPAVASSLSQDGSTLVFSRDRNLYIYDVAAETLTLFAGAGSTTSFPCISPDASTILGYGSNPSGLFITNRILHTLYLGNGFPTNAFFSADSKYVFFGTGYLKALHTSTYQTNYLNFVDHPSASAHGLAVAFDTTNSFAAQDFGQRDVYVWNLSDNSVELISVSADGSSGGNLDSDHSSISPDGRYVLFQSRATNLVTGVTNIQSKVYLRDRSSKTTTLVAGGLGSDDSISSNPHFSPDGKLVLYRGKPDFSADPNALTFYFQAPPTVYVDTDNDGIDDNWEYLYFGNLGRNGSGDFDGDGQTDWEEYRAGTDPTNSQSAFKGLPVGRDDQGRILLHWKIQANLRYKIQFKSSLADSQWTDLVLTITNSGDEAQAADMVPAGTTSRFYRVVLLP